MAALKLVIFDCDGVMFDSKDANRKYYNHLLEEFGYPLMDRQEEDYVHSHNVLDSVAYIFRKVGLPLALFDPRFHISMHIPRRLKHMCPHLPA